VVEELWAMLARGRSFKWWPDDPNVPGRAIKK
jgi:hypothetical protein